MEDEELDAGAEWVSRVDSAIKFTSWEVTEEGYLLVKGTAAAVGTMTYVNADGTTRLELVDNETLQASYASLLHKVVTDEHPATSSGPLLLDATTTSKYQRGEVIGVSHDSETGRTDVELIIRDARTIRKIQAGKLLGLSPGYRLRRDPAPPGSGADLIQRERRYNHLALTKAPRRGMETSIHLDSEDNVILKPPTETRMEPEDTANSGENQNPAADPSAGFDALSGRIDALTASVAALSARIPEPAPAVNTDADEAPPAADDFLARFEAHRKALAVAEGLEVAIDAADSTDAIKRKIVAARLGESFDSEATDGYIDAAFAFIEHDAAKRAENAGTLDAFGSAFNLPGARTTGFDSKDKFVPVDPTRLECGRKAAKTNPKQEG